MQQRRLIPGLIAILAMTLSFGEAVWVSTCAPGMDMSNSAMAMGDRAAAAHDPMPDTKNASNDEHGPSDDAGRCPLGPLAAAQGCVGLASLPARALAFAAPAAGGTSRMAFDNAQHNLLFETAVFHPPRA